MDMKTIVIIMVEDQGMALMDNIMKDIMLEVGIANTEVMGI